MSKQLDMREAIAVIAVHAVAVELLAQFITKCGWGDTQTTKGTFLRLASNAVRELSTEQVEAILRSHLEELDHA